ncbi:M1 family metallopeptidase [Planctomycetes bacterium Poly30]|uniref:M1 family metallopeptidase n=1 Tax=Saltatorellus ferox TaxID=2528018 RepID=UPI00119C9AA3
MTSDPVLRFRCGAALAIGAAFGCQGPSPEAEAVRVKDVAAADPGRALVERLAGIDVLHVDLWESGERAARIEGLAQLDRTPSVAGGYALAGRPVRLSFLHDPDADAAADGSLRRVVVELNWLGVDASALPAASVPASVEPLLRGLDPADRATLVVHTAGGRPWDLGLAPLSYHAEQLREMALAEDAARSAAIPSAAPFADSEPAGDALQRAALDPFLRFCEAELLVRRPDVQQPYGASPASVWFGDVVAIDPGPDGAALRCLSGLMHRLFLEDLPGGVAAEEAERAHTPSLDEDWAVPRFLALREMMGKEAFRGLLRAFVDAHRGGKAVTWDDLATAAEAVAPDLGARFVRAWLRNPSEARVKTRWRYDEARGRVLLRVDQVHELQGGQVAPAFPFLLPVSITDAAGNVTREVLEIDKRRDLLEIDAPTLPVRFDVDPDETLAPLLTLEPSDPEDPEAR